MGGRAVSHASASLVTSSVGVPRRNAKLIHDHGKATQYLKKEMLKAISANKPDDMEQVLKLAKEFGIKEKEIYPHGYKKQ